MHYAVEIGSFLCASGLGERHEAVRQGCISAGSDASSRFPSPVPLLQVSEQIAPSGAQIPSHQEGSNAIGGRQEGGACILEVKHIHTPYSCTHGFIPTILIPQVRWGHLVITFYPFLSKPFWSQ